ncbi:response regulator transcription factor [Pseudonocardia yuanmonensis]|uniref:response regulator transcription factor n=1 Tax=Pseudonocardia yuanmonensis TaxID=1095914 RepID=UPI0031E992EB
MTALTAARELRSFLRRHGSRTPGAAAAALEGLRPVLPADCVALSSWDPAARRHRTLASSYPAAVTDMLDGRMHADPLFVSVRSARVPVRVRDLAPRRRRGEIFDRIITPLGFRDGVTQCLFAADGRYVGMLNASTLDGRQPDDDTVALLDLLGPEFAAALDPVPAPRYPTGQLVAGEVDGFVVDVHGGITPLSPAPRPDLVTPPSPLAEVVERVRAGSPPPVAVLHLVRQDAVVAVELSATPSGVVLLHREVPPPGGLTARELHVLDGIARGLSNTEIAAAHGIGSRTVATHVEHILAKTGCRNRVEAARLASQWGLLVDP